LQRVDNPNVAVRVENISPHGPPFDDNRGVTFVVTLERGLGFPAEGFLATDITVLDDKPFETQIDL
jgi:hypothetical protein